MKVVVIALVRMKMFKYLLKHYSPNVIGFWGSLIICMIVSVAIVTFMLLQTRDSIVLTMPSSIYPVDNSTMSVWVCHLSDGRIIRSEVYGPVSAEHIKLLGTGCHKVGDDPRGSY